MVENNMMAIVVVVSAPTCLILNFVLRVAKPTQGKKKQKLCKCWRKNPANNNDWSNPIILA